MIIRDNVSYSGCTEDVGGQRIIQLGTTCTLTCPENLGMTGGELVVFRRLLIQYVPCVFQTSGDE